MNPEKQRIAIAEACGWKIIRQRYSPSCTSDMWALVKDNRCFSSGARSRADEPDVFTLSDYVNLFKEKNVLPDYLNDLNAMHEAEKTLHGEQAVLFVDALCSLIHGVDPGYFSRVSWELAAEIVSATAAQRAEAFLRTIGKWEDA